MKKFTREELIKMYFDNLDGPLQYLSDDIIEKFFSTQNQDYLILEKPPFRRKISKNEAYALENNLLVIARQLLASLKSSVKIRPEFSFVAEKELETMIADREFFENCNKCELPISDLEDIAAARLRNSRFEITRQLIESLNN